MIDYFVKLQHVQGSNMSDENFKFLRLFSTKTKPKITDILYYEHILFYPIIEKTTRKIKKIASLEFTIQI